MKRRILVSAVLSVLLLAALAANVHAAEVKIIASDGAKYDYFGGSVAISGDYIIVGAPYAYDLDNSGSAYIFKRNGTTWTEQDKINTSDSVGRDYFGRSVAISSDYAVVGDGLSSGSSVHIFKRNGTAWEEHAKINASDGAAGDRFGYSVAISGDYAVVGAYGGDDDAGERSGSAYIFKRDGTAWTEQAKITASDGAAGDHFSGDYAVVGAYGGDDAGWMSGSAYIFKRNGTAWEERAKITASDAMAEDFFGTSVAISSDYAVMSAYGDDDAGERSGSAYIFKRDGTAWTEQAKITASDGAAGDHFVSHDDDTVLNSGSAYIYNIPIGIFSCDSDGNPVDQFAPGETVYVTGTNLATSTSYKLWIQNESVGVGDALATGEDPSGAQESVDTYANGTLPVTAIWAIDPGATVTHTKYDIVADNQVAGEVGTYHASSDLLDSASVAGFVAPVPGKYVFTPVDAAIALQIAVGSRPPDPHWDVSGDGQITSLDAFMILQAAAGAIEL